MKKFLKSKTWETRVAAAQALGSIVEHSTHPSLEENLKIVEKVANDFGLIKKFQEFNSEEETVLEIKTEQCLNFERY